MRNSFGIQRPIGTNVNDLTWVEKLSTDTDYSVTGKENGWGVRISWSGPNTPLTMFTTTANKALPLSPCLEHDLKSYFAAADIIGTVYCEILGDDSTNHTRNGFAQAQQAMSRVCDRSPLTLNTFQREHLVLVALYDSDRAGMVPSASNRLERLKRLPRIFTDDKGIVTYAKGAHVVCVEIIQENVDQRQLAGVITAWLTKCRLGKATPREGLVIRAEDSALTTFGEVRRVEKNYRSATTWKVKQMCRQKVQILKISDNGTSAMFKDSSGAKLKTIPVMQETQYKLRAWDRNPDREPLEAQVLLIYEDVGKDSPVRWSVLCYLLENRGKQQIDGLEQHEESFRPREALKLRNGNTTAEGVEDEPEMLQGYTQAAKDPTTRIKNDRLMAVYAEENRQLALQEAEEAAEAAAATERRQLRERVSVSRPFERQDRAGGVPMAYGWRTEYEKSEEMAEDEARVQVLGDDWMPSLDKLVPPPERAETLKKSMAYDKRRDELRNELEARMQRDRFIFEQKAEDRMAREYARYIEYYGTTSSQRESASAAVALYDERIHNTRQLEEHVHFSNFTEAKIRQAGREIDQRIENQRSQRAYNFSKAPAVRDQRNQHIENQRSQREDYREAQADQSDQSETQSQDKFTRYGHGKRDKSGLLRQAKEVSQKTPPSRAPKGGKACVDVLPSPEKHLPTWERNCELRKASVDPKQGKTGDVYQLMAVDCDSGGSGSAAQHGRPTTPASPVPVFNYRDMDPRDIERIAKDIMLSNMQSRLNMTLEQFRPMWLAASEEEKSKIFDSIVA